MEDKSILHLALEKTLSDLTESKEEIKEIQSPNEIFFALQSDIVTKSLIGVGFLLKDINIKTLAYNIRDFYIKEKPFSFFDINESPYTGNSSIVDKEAKIHFEVMDLGQNKLFVIATDEVKQEVYVLFFCNAIDSPDKIPAFLAYIQVKYMEVKQELEKQKESLDTPTSKKIEELLYTVKSIKEHFERRIEKLIQKIDKLSNS